MANPFQRYQSGGFEAVPGIAQAGANIGQMLGAGFTNFGSAIGSGIKQYYENKAKSAAALQEIEVIGPQLLARRNAYLEASGIDPATLDRYMQDDPSEGTDDEMFKAVSSNPMVQLARTLDPAIEALKKAPTQGLSAQLQAVNSAKASIGMVEEQMKLQDFISKYRLEQVTNELPGSVLQEQDVVTPGVQVDPNNPFLLEAKKLKQQLRASGASPAEVDAALDDFISKVEKKVTSDEAIGTPEQRQAYLDSIKRVRTQEVDKDNLEENYYGMMERMSREKDAEDVKSLQKEWIDSLPPERPNKALEEAKARLPELRKQAKELEAKIKSGESLEPTLADQTMELGRGAVERINALAGERFAKSLASRIKSGVKITPDVADLLVKGVHEDLGGGLLGLGATLSDYTKFLQPAFLTTGVPGERRLTTNERKNVEDAIRAYQAKERNRRAMERSPVEERQLAATKAEIARLEGVEATGKKAPTQEDVKKTQAPVAPSKPFEIGELSLGTRMVERSLNAAEKEEAAREFYSKRFGSVPVGFTQMYRQMFPESNIRTTEVNGIPVMIDGKGNVTPLVSDKGRDVEKEAKENALTFNNTEIADGVRLTGVFSGNVDAATKFRFDYSHMANVRQAVDELIKINDMGYETLSPTARERAKQLQSEIVAAMRIPIIGPGQVAIYEQEILQDIIKRGTGFFTLEASERSALKGLKDRLDRELVSWPKSMGLKVSIGGQSSETIKRARMQRLRTERRIQPIGEAR